MISNKETFHFTFKAQIFMINWQRSGLQSRAFTAAPCKRRCKYMQVLNICIWSIEHKNVYKQFKHFNSLNFAEWLDTTCGKWKIYWQEIIVDEEQHLYRVHPVVRTPNKPSVTDSRAGASPLNLRCVCNPMCPFPSSGPVGRHTPHSLAKST